MTIIELLSTLRKRDIQLWVEGARLRYDAPAGALTPDLRDILKARKAELIALLQEFQPREDIPPITSADRDQPLALSFAQQRLWFLDQWQPNSTAYHVPLLARLQGRLDRTALDDSLAALVQRHEILRTTFRLADGQPVQVIHAEPLLRVTYHDLRLLPAETREQEAFCLARQQAQQPFDLSTGPLTRGVLVQLDETEHLLVVIMHHIITDGWSMHIVTHEVGEMYRALIEQRSPRLAPLPVQYADFASWQRRHLQGPTEERLLAYWQRHLQGVPALIDVPTDRPRPPIQTLRGAQHSFRLSKELTAGLRGLGQRADATLFMTLLTGLMCLLARYTGQPDVVVGTPVANRTHDALKGLIGFFVNMLALRVDLSDNPPGVEALRRVRAVCMDGYAHQELPFERLVEVLQPERSMSYPPIVQVMLVLQNLPSATIELPDLKLTPIDFESQVAKLDLTLIMTEQDDGLSAIVEYNADLFDAATIERFSQHFQIVLRALVADPERRIAMLPLLTPPEQQQILVDWNATSVRYAEDRWVHQLVEQQAIRTPDALAVIYGQEQLTYEELNCRAEQLAVYLQTLGVRPEARVGICLERSPELLVGVLGVLKAGGAYVPLDPSHPRQRLSYMITDSATRVVLTEQRLASALQEHDGQLVCLDYDWPTIASSYAEHQRGSDAQDTQPVSGANLAYVIYTSGSTGRPKGVMVTHQGLSNYVQWAVAAYGVADGQGTVVQSPLGFDLTVTSLLTPLVCGRSVRLLPEAQDIEALSESLNARVDYSLVKITPAHLDVLRTTLDPATLAGQTRCLVIGGEALTYDTIALWRTHAPMTRLINEYGPTETVVGCCVYDVSPHDASEGVVPIGRPIANTQLYILSPQMEPVPVGVPGELYIGGVQLARGYLNRPALTAERFVPNPFSHPEDARPGARLYRTGDLARWLPSGDIDFLGRIDGQVKVRGFRIEPQEVETVLAHYPGVQSVAVVLREDRPGDKRLVAYMVTEEEPRTKNQEPEPGTDGSGFSALGSSSELRSFLTQQLPEYMIPSAFVVMDKLPLTANGKLDISALPTPDPADSERVTTLVAPRTEQEGVLLTLWQQVLGRDAIGVTDDFFVLGGHSLLATQLVTRIRSTFSVDLPLRAVFEDRTIANLATRLSSAKQRPAAPSPVTVGRDQPLPLSFAQQRLWFLDRLMPNTASYTVPAAVTLHGTLDTAALASSLEAIIARHEVLRTVFTTVDQQPVQRILSPSSSGAALTLMDMQYVPVAEQTEAVQRHMHTVVQQPFDLEHGPLLRATLLRLSPTRHVLLLVLHHIITDGWSMGVLVQELAQIYHALVCAETPILPPLPVQYADYAFWQRTCQGATLEQQLDYWRRQLDGVPDTVTLPTDHPRRPIQSVRGATHALQLSPDLTQALKQLSQREGVTLFMTLLSTFAILLHRSSEQTDVVIGSPVAGRTHPEIEGLIGCFTNMLVLRTDLSGNPTFRELLGRVRETTLQAYAHQDVPFEQIVEALQPERTLSHTPLFQVALALQNTPIPSLELPDLQIQPLAIDPGTAKFDLMLVLSESADALSGVLEYSTDLFEPPTIVRLARHFTTLVEAIVADPTQHIATLPLLSAAEQADLLAVSRSSLIVPVAAQTITDLFEAQAARTPDAVALVCGDAQLRYAELNRRANQLAHYLQALGVGSGTYVGVYLDRSLELVVALLAVLKAGAAYVPLDPAYPSERVAFILRDTCASVLLSQQSLVASLASADRERVVCLDTDWAEIARQPDESPTRTAAPDDLIYVIYTSGSTGRPKGVLVTHRNVARLFAATDHWFHFGPQDVWTLFHSTAFDFSVWEIWGALLHGGRLVVVPYLVSRSPEAFYDLLLAERVTVLNQTPSAFRQLIQADEIATERSDLALRLVIFGGEALDVQSLQPWFARHGDQQPQLVNMYGITETTVHVTYRPLALADLDGSAGSVIGQSIPDLQVYVLDQQRQLVPIGVPGELYVGGTGVARGYLHRPALTAERFVPDPWSTTPGARLYRTGDLARRLSNGDLEYLGRIDGQVKLRGFRIELQEIERVLAQHPIVRTAIVMLREDRPGDKQLVAYIVGEPRTKNQALGEAVRTDSLWANQEPEGGTDGSRFLVLGSDLRSFLKTKLPEYMIPSAFVALDALPLTANGKLDLRALPAPDHARPELDTAFVAPRTANEQLLADIWAQVLGHDRVGVEDTFFSLGGDSIRSIQMLARAREHGLELSLQQLFQHQTIARLAEVAGTTSRSADEQRLSQPFALVEAEDRLRLPQEVEDAYPLTMLQAGMLFHSAYHPDSSIYHNITSLHVRMPLDVERLRVALQEVLDRHAVLRTAFDLSSYSTPLQLVYRAVEPPLSVADLVSLSSDAQESALSLWFEGEKEQPFDWTCAPLIRFTVHRRSAAAFQFSCTEHHAVLDGWSVASLFVELFQRYVRLLLDPHAPLLPTPALTFREYVALEQQALASEAHRRFWLDALRDYRSIQLPRLLSSSDAGSPPAETIRHTVAIPQHISAGLQELAARQGVPLKTVLLAAHLRVLALLGGTTDVLGGLVVHGRPQALTAERVLGLFLNTVPFRLQLGIGSWRDLIRATFAAEQALQPFIHYPLAEIQQLVGGTPLFETIFNFIHFHVYEEVAHIPALEVVDIRSFERTNFLFGVNFSLDSGTHAVALRLDSESAAIGMEQIARIAGYYQRVLATMVDAPDRSYLAFSPLSDVEHDQLLRWNPAALPLHPDVPACLHQLFEAQVDRTPGALAATDGVTTLSYAALEQRANEIAHTLRALGVRAESPVAVCTRQPLDRLAGLLGVLKAGGVYLPIDPAYPLDRRTFMLHDARVQVLLGEASLTVELPADLRLVPLDDAVDRVVAASATRLAAAALPDNLAYIIYTSGSTGVPKGVAISHASATAHLRTLVQVKQLAADDRVLQFASPSFDVSIEELLTPLLVGATVIMRGDTLWSAAELTQQLVAQQISVANLPPAYWQQWLYAWIAAGDPPPPAHLRLLIVGGEGLPPEPVQRWQTTTLASVPLVNAYGPTETTVTATIAHISDEHTWSDELSFLPIGQPLPGRTAYVLDQRGQLVPLGVAGELYLGGTGVARGYLHRAALTAERFRPDPWSTTPGARLYATGDLVRRDSDGTLIFLGRLDHQVKLRGFRIELGEIETALRELPGVRDAVVVVREDVSPAGGDPERRLVAYIVKEPTSADGASALAPLDSAALERLLKQRLPAFMVPNTFVLLDALPLLPNGKIDRRALPAPGTERAVPQSIVVPRDAVEMQLTQIWERVLNLRPVSVASNFFELGGHSLLALRVVSQIKQQFGLDIALAALFQAPTIEQLALLVRQHHAPLPGSVLVPLQPQGSGIPVFCVHPIGGTVLCYRELAAALGPDQPLYGLQSAGVIGALPSGAPVEDLAAQYLQAIQTVQPEGPYLLCGWSFGGLVAFEMARQLQQRNAQVGALVVIDSRLPEPDDLKVQLSEARLAALFAADTLGLASQPVPIAWEQIEALPVDQQLTFLIEQARAQDLLPPDVEPEQLRQLFEVFKLHTRAIHQYMPQPYTGNVLLLTADQADDKIVQRWRRYVEGALVVHQLGGDHYSLLRQPYVSRLAEHVRQTLEPLTAGPTSD